MTIRTFTVPGEARDEALRLAILERLQILSRPVPDDVDALVLETARIFAVPISLVSIVTQDQQCFAASHGLDVPSTPRSISFCGHAVEAARPLVVPDAARDLRFAGNPLVVGAPHIRFYAGAPLIASEGLPIGTLCVIDTVPHEVSAADVIRLEAQAARVMALFEAGRTEDER